MKAKIIAWEWVECESGHGEYIKATLSTGHIVCAGDGGSILDQERDRFCRARGIEFVPEDEA